MTKAAPAALAFVVFPAAASAVVPSFDVTPIDPGLTPRSVNVGGLVVGYAGSDLGDVAASWTVSGGLNSLDGGTAPGGEPLPTSRAFAVDASDRIGGYGQSGNDFFAAIWGDPTDAPTVFAPNLPPGDVPRTPSAAVTGLADAGHAVGWANRLQASSIQAARWSADGAVLLADVDDPRPVPFGTSYANAVNDAGIVVGVDLVTDATQSVFYPVRWDADGVPTVLEVPAGQDTAANTQAWDINDSGLVSGAVLGDPRLWDSDGDVIPLTTPAGVMATSDGLNDLDDAGRVIGPTDDGGRPLIWLDPAGGDVAVYVDDLLDDDSWRITSAIDIAGDDGVVRVVGTAINPLVNGGDPVPVLLTAVVPEPATAGILVVAGLMLARRRRGSRGARPRASGAT